MIAALVFAIQAATASPDFVKAMQVLNDEGCAAADPLFAGVTQRSQSADERRKATLERARCADDVDVALGLYRKLAGADAEDEVAAVTAINEAATLLLAAGRAPEAVALYETPGSRDPAIQLSMHYSEAVARAAAGDRDRALGLLADVLARDALFASAADEAVELVSAAGLEAAVANLPRAAEALDRAGLHDVAGRGVLAALRRSDVCNDRLEAVVGKAFLAHAARAKTVERDFAGVWSPALDRTTCAGLRDLGKSFAAILGDDAPRMKRGANRLREIAPPNEVSAILQHAAENDLLAWHTRPAFLKYILASELVPSDGQALAQAAYTLRFEASPAEFERVSAQLANAREALSAESRADVHLQLGHAYAAKNRLDDGVRAWLQAEELYGEKAVPELRMSIARVETKRGNRAAARSHLWHAASDCAALKRDTCVRASLGEGVKLGLIDEEMAQRYNVPRDGLGPPNGRR